MKGTSHKNALTFALLPVLLFSLCLTGGNHVPKETFTNIPYKQTEAAPNFTSLDVYTPESSGSFPVIVYVHGGAWEAGDKKHVSRKPDYFVRNGFVFVSVNYRLSPSFMHPAHVEDVADAIAWIHSNIEKYGGDRKCIFLVGHSAGAHLVSLVSTDEDYLRKAGLDLSVIRGTVSLDSDYYDIPFSLNQGQDVRPLLEEVFGNDTASWENASPINHIEKGKHIPPFLLVYVARRKEMTGVQARRMEERLEENDIFVEVYEAQYKSHGTLDEDLGKPYDEPTEIIMRFLRYILTINQRQC